MKLFSKVITLSTLLTFLVVVPTFARDHKSCCEGKVVGSYIVTVTFPEGGTNNKGVAVLHEDGTMIVSEVIDENEGKTFFVGSWKCKTKSCIEFCATSLLIENTPSSVLETVQISGTACFNNEGKLCGNDFTYRTFRDGNCLGKFSPLNVCFTPQHCNLTDRCG